MESQPIAWNSEHVRITASFGVAVVNPTDQDPLAAVARADAALYRAKERGRNDVQVEDQPPALV
jgi:diguanylate cyclase (GGDEF)-like protein